MLLRGHVGEIPALAFTPDGQRLASAGADGTVRIWPTAGGEPLIFAHPRTSVPNLAFGPGGRIVTADSRGTLRDWPCAACGPLHHVLTLADTRITRTLTAEERGLFLDDPSP